MLGPALGQDVFYFKYLSKAYELFLGDQIFNPKALNFSIFCIISHTISLNLKWVKYTGRQPS